MPCKTLSAGAAAALGGCRGEQSILDPHGPAAAAIVEAHWIMLAGASAILLVVMALALYAVFRPQRARAPSSSALIVGGGLVLPVLALSALLVYGVALSEKLRGAPAGGLHLEVVAHQWWWEVRYPAAGGGTVATANEIRLPAGVPVSIALTSEDVIHSFWIPSLAGKIDAIPGRANRLVLQAERAGVFRGQCAEFCGAQHARMALYATAEAPQDFERWLQGLRAPARGTGAAGERLFLQHCAECHVVRGVAERAARMAAPDLTHVASRAWLGGAGTLANTPENHVHWMAHNDRVKPGNRMPGFRHLENAELQAIAAWLATLE